MCTLTSLNNAVVPKLTNVGMYTKLFLIINIFGHRGRDIVANLLRNIITNLARLIDIIANLVKRKNKNEKIYS